MNFIKRIFYNPAKEKVKQNKKSISKLEEEIKLANLAKAEAQKYAELQKIRNETSKLRNNVQKTTMYQNAHALHSLLNSGSLNFKHNNLATIADSMLGVARDLEQHDPIAVSIIKTFRAFIVGEKGITVTPQPLLLNGEVDKELSKLLKIKWQEFCKDPLVNIKSHDWICFLYDLVANGLRDGDVFVIICNDYGKFKLQMLTADYLDYGSTLGKEPIEKDKFGRPLIYNFKTEEYGVYRSVNASNVLTFGNFLVSGQDRGISVFAPILKLLEDMRKFIDATLDRSNIESKITSVIEYPLDPDNPEVDEEVNTITLEGGSTVLQLPAGAKYHQNVVGQAGSSFSDFLKTYNKMIAAAVGLSYEAISNHNDSSFSASRQSMINAQAKINDRINLLISKIVRPIYTEFVNYLLSNDYDLKNYDKADYISVSNANYHTGKLPSIDPAKDAKAAQTLVRAGLVSKTTIRKNLGLDPDAEDRSIDKEFQEAKEKGYLSAFYEFSKVLDPTLEDENDEDQDEDDMESEEDD